MYDDAPDYDTAPLGSGAGCRQPTKVLWILRRARSWEATMRDCARGSTGMQTRSGAWMRVSFVPAVVLGAAQLIVVGCGVPPEPVPVDSGVSKLGAVAVEQGLVWMFPGLVGTPWELGPAYRAFRDAGVDQAVRFFTWGVPAPDFMSHLTRYEDNLDQARAVANEIIAYRRDHPQRPIDLVGYSAGGFIALLVAEALPPDVHVRRVIAAQPDISPTYDLTAALSRIDDRLVVFYSPDEWFLTDQFTEAVGTMDRQHVTSAGRFGFDLEVAVPDPALRAKVEQIGWQPEMSAVARSWDHLSILGYEWNREFVAPYITDAPATITAE